MSGLTLGDLFNFFLSAGSLNRIEMTPPVISPEVAVGIRDLVGNTLSLCVCVWDPVWNYFSESS